MIVLGKAVLGALVLWSVVRHALRTCNDLAHHELPVNFRPIYLALAALVYLADLLCSTLFYHDVLKASHAPIGLLPAVRAYLMSHLAKHVPGKAIVVVMGGKPVRGIGRARGQRRRSRCSTKGW